jgi:beta-lactamase regulating signal transducer with metallopeptidase domain
VLVGVFLTGTTLGLARLVLGLWAVRRLVRRSRLLTDGPLTELAERLCAELGVGRSVPLYECDELTSPATVGWLRPRVLLPADWPSWDEQERRAVLAHELAHVRRRDYLSCLLARVSLALHFYHPLLYWLVNRLHLHQELAADALGARCAGGPQPYLRVLARLTLRQHDRPAAGPALAFLSSPGTLLRRIVMLRTRDGLFSVSPPHRSRAVGWVLLTLAALAMSALRGSAQKQEGPTPRSPEIVGERTESVQDTDEAELPPFDLSYLDADAQGFFACRPAALLARPELKTHREQVNQALHAGFAQLSAEGGKIELSIEDIEQLSFSFRILPGPKAKPEDEDRHMVVSKRMLVRTVRPHDWKKTLTALVPGLQEKQIEGRTCYAVPRFALPILGVEICFHIPDNRTLLMDTEEEFRVLFRGKDRKAPAPAWARHWKQVEGCTVAVAVADVRTLMANRKPDPPDEFPVVQLLQVSKAIVMGAEINEGLRCHFLVEAATEAEAENIVRETRRQMEKGADAARQPANGSAQALRVLADVCAGYEVKRDGTTVRWHGGSNVSAVDLLEVVLSGEHPW